MKLNHLTLIEEGIEKIIAATGNDKLEIIDALTGVAWCEEHRGDIVNFMIENLDDK